MVTLIVQKSVMFTFLKQPYPLDQSFQSVIKSSIGVSLFVALFLMLLQPFGLHQVNGSGKYLFITGFGMVCFVVMLLNNLVLTRLLPTIFTEEKWTVFKEAIWLLWHILSIGTANLLYANFENVTTISLEGFFLFQGFTLLVGVFPLTFFVVLNQNRLLRQNLKKAQALDQQLKERPIPAPTVANIVIKGEKAKDQVSLALSELLLISAADNYVVIFQKTTSGIEKTMLRNTLKQVATQLVEYPTLFRCHRSYFVNLDLIEKVAGNSQGYKLHFPNLPDPIPVSRSVAKDLIQLVNGET